MFLDNWSLVIQILRKTHGNLMRQKADTFNNKDKFEKIKKS